MYTKAIEIIERLMEELEDAKDFMDTFDGFPEGIGCACDAESLESPHCICIDDEGNMKRIKDKETVLEEAEAIIIEMKEGR